MIEPNTTAHITPGKSITLLDTSVISCPLLLSCVLNLVWKKTQKYVKYIKKKMKYIWTVDRQTSLSNFRGRFAKCPLKMNGFIKQPVSDEKVILGDISYSVPPLNLCIQICVYLKQPVSWKYSLFKRKFYNCHLKMDSFMKQLVSDETAILGGDVDYMPAPMNTIV